MVAKSVCLPQTAADTDLNIHPVSGDTPPPNSVHHTNLCLPTITSRRCLLYKTMLESIFTCDCSPPSAWPAVVAPNLFLCVTVVTAPMLALVIFRAASLAFTMQPYTHDYLLPIFLLGFMRGSHDFLFTYGLGLWCTEAISRFTPNFKLSLYF